MLLVDAGSRQVCSALQESPSEGIDTQEKPTNNDQKQHRHSSKYNNDGNNEEDASSAHFN